MKTEVTKIEDLTTGTYVITTLSGTQHFLDLDAHEAVRIATPEHAWSGWNGLTPDGSTMRYWTIRGFDLDTREYSDSLELGQHMRLDNRDEWRVSTEIKKIERVEN